jgi:hypothetical protein
MQRIPTTSRRRFLQVVSTSAVNQPAFAGYVKEQVGQLAPAVRGAGVKL